MKKFLWNVCWNRGLGWSLFRILGTAYALFLVAWVLLESRLVYLPAKFPDGPWDLGKAVPGEGIIGPVVREVSFPAGDGVILHGWHGLLARGGKDNFEPLPTDRLILWFHGNGGNVAFHYAELLDMVDCNAEVFLVDYRGYGKSLGRPSEAGLTLDALGAWKHATQTLQFPPDRIVIFGETLGAAVAIDLAASVKPAGLVLQSPFTSVPDVVGPILPILPRSLIRSKFDALRRIPDVTSPILIAHSLEDEVIPIEMGRRLLEAAKAPKEFLEIPAANHDQTWRDGGNDYRDRLQTFLDRCAPSKVFQPKNEIPKAKGKTGEDAPVKAGEPDPPKGGPAPGPKNAPVTP